MSALIATPLGDVKQLKRRPPAGTGAGSGAGAGAASSPAALDSPVGGALVRPAVRNVRGNEPEAKSFVRRLNDFLSRNDNEESLLKRLQEQVERQKNTSDDPAVWHAKLAAELTRSENDMRSEFARIDHALRDARLADDSESTRRAARDAWQREFEARMNETTQRVDDECALVRGSLRATADELRRQLRRVEHGPKPATTDDDDADASTVNGGGAGSNGAASPRSSDAAPSSTNATPLRDGKTAHDDNDDDEEFYDVDERQFALRTVSQ